METFQVRFGSLLELTSIQVTLNWTNEWNNVQNILVTNNTTPSEIDFIDSPANILVPFGPNEDSGSLHITLDGSFRLFIVSTNFSQPSILQRIARESSVSNLDALSFENPLIVTRNASKPIANGTTQLFPADYVVGIASSATIRELRLYFSAPNATNSSASSPIVLSGGS